MKNRLRKKLKPIPCFKSEDEEHKFWATHDTTDYIDWTKAVKNPSFPQLKPSTQTISIRLPESLLSEIKQIAHKKDVPYQSLMKIFLSERVQSEFAPSH